MNVFNGDTLELIPQYQIEPKFPNNTVIRRKTNIVPINSKFRNKKLYPDANNFKISLGKTFNNVERIELVSSIFPNCDHVIKGSENGSLQNNVLKWYNRNDLTESVFNDLTFAHIGDSYYFSCYNYPSPITSGPIEIFIFNSGTEIDGERTVYYDSITIDSYDNHTVITTFKFIYDNVGDVIVASVNMPQVEYSIQIPSGNYDVNEVTAIIQDNMNKVRKIDGDFNYFAVDINTQTDLLTFSQFQIALLPDNPITTTAGSYDIMISFPGHPFQTGDTALFIGISDVGGISSDVLNLQYSVIPVDFQTLKITVPTKASVSTIGGGTNCKVGEPTFFKFLFNPYDRYYNSNKGLIANNLGFLQENSGLATFNYNPISTVNFNVTDILTHPDFTQLTLNDNVQGVLKPSYKIQVIDYDNNLKILSTATNHFVTKEQLIYVDDIGYILVRPLSINFLYVLSEVKNEITPAQNIRHGDTIQVTNIVYKGIANPTFFVESVNGNVVTIASWVSKYYVIDPLQSFNVYTELLLVQHTSHGFNEIDTILNPDSYYTIDSINDTAEFHFINPITFRTNSLTNPTTIDIVYGLLTFSETPSEKFNPNLDVSVGDFLYLAFNNLGGGYTANNLLCKVVNVNLGAFTFQTQLSDTSINASYPIGSTNIIYNATPFLTLSQTLLDGTYYNFSTTESDSHIITLTSTNLPNTTTQQTTGVLNTKRNEVQLYNLVDTTNQIDVDTINNKTYKVRCNGDNDSYYIVTPRMYHPIFNFTFGGSIRVSSDIHGYDQKRSNTVTWYASDKLNQSINLQGENYVFMLTDISNTGLLSLNTTGGDIFSQIILNNPPGNYVFDSFITEPIIFDELLNKISEMTFKIVYDSGDLYDFKNLDYSFTLKITTVEKILQATSTRNYLSTNDLKENTFYLN